MIMEKMDLEDWELLPKNSFTDLDLDHDENHDGAMEMEYFFGPSTQKPLHKTELPPRSVVVPKKQLQVSIAWEPVLDHENKKIPKNSDFDPDPYPDLKQTLSTDSVPSPRVSFKNTKEAEFVDMNIDPPARIMSHLLQIDDAASNPSGLEGDDDLRGKEKVILEEEDNDGNGGERLNLWKAGLNGIGAICSFGVAAAAATVCVFFLGHKNIKICKNKNQMIKFQLNSDENKRMKEFVNHATNINEAKFGMKGVPVVRAQISFGGYHDRL